MNGRIELGDVLARRGDEERYRERAQGEKMMRVEEDGQGGKGERHRRRGTSATISKAEGRGRARTTRPSPRTEITFDEVSAERRGR